LLVRIADPHLQSHAAKSGEDVYFASADQVSPLDFEIESYGETGELVAWVRMPSLTAGTDTALYLGYGDGRSGRASPDGVWRDFHNVWHLSQDPSGGMGAIRDSTARAHGTAQGAMTASARVPGVAGLGLAFDGNDDQIAFINDIVGNVPSTVSGWVRQHESHSKYGSSMLALGNGEDGQARYVLPFIARNLTVRCGFYAVDDDATASLPIGEWKYLTWIWDGGASTLYIDAVRVLGPVNHTGVNTRGGAGRIGNSTFEFEYFMSGDLDELRIATQARSSAWITTEYANQRPASSFITVLGDPEPAPAH
jgi:MSHA biogenesis protein MshQ